VEVNRVYVSMTGECKCGYSRFRPQLCLRRVREDGMRDNKREPAVDDQWTGKGQDNEYCMSKGS